MERSFVFEPISQIYFGVSVVLPAGAVEPMSPTTALATAGATPVLG